MENELLKITTRNLILEESKKLSNATINKDYKAVAEIKEALQKYITYYLKIDERNK